MLASGCLPGGDDESQVANDRADRLSGTPNAGGCVDFAGLKNCALGDAKLAPSRDGTALEATGLRTAGRDGVSFLLPEATDFEVTGTRRESASSTVFTRAISGGEVTSTMTVRNTDDGFDVSGTFTGNERSTYDAQLFRGGEMVGTIPRLQSGGDGFHALWYRRPIIWIIQIGFHIYIWIFRTEVQTADATEGACVWDFDVPKDSLASTTLPDGTDVTFDRVKLVENLDPGGAYPYLTFDRIDYTSNDGALHITGESAR